MQVRFVDNPKGVVVQADELVRELMLERGYPKSCITAHTLPGIVRHLEPGSVNTEVTLEIAPGITIASIITKHAVESLGLKVGSKAYAVIKASSVMVGTD